MIKKFLLISIVFLSQYSFAVVMPNPPELKARANITIDFHTGKILQANNHTKKLPIASVTKVMTAFVVFSEIEKGTISLKDQVKISGNAWQKPGSSMYIEIGKDVLLNDLIKGLLAQSGNDAAIALAEHIAGSEEAFSALMNKYAKHIGMTSSNFRNATGLHHSDHYSTALDLSILGRKTIQDFPEMYKYFSIKNFEFNNIAQKNRNKLIHGNDNKYDGFKTGYTSKSKYCIMASAQHSERRVIVVVIGASKSSERFEEAKVMANYGLKFFENYKLKLKNSSDFLISIPTYYANEDFLKVKLDDGFLETLPRGTKKNITINADIPNVIKHAVNKGDIIGNINIILDGKIIKEINIVSDHSLTESSGFKYWSDYIILNWLN
jgi:D-alanyl-D-alanine carboxypeptidase (penicillin-binding protein 5/6)